jgi:hypothetical protein
LRAAPNAAVDQVRYRRVFSRFDKDARSYLAFGHDASIVIWLKYTRQRSLANDWC